MQLKQQSPSSEYMIHTLYAGKYSYTYQIELMKNNFSTTSSANEAQKKIKKAIGKHFATLRYRLPTHETYYKQTRTV